MRIVQIVYYMFLYAHFFIILITYLVHMTFHKENPTHSEVHSIQHHVIKFCQVGVFLSGYSGVLHQYERNGTAEIFLSGALKTLTLALYFPIRIEIIHGGYS